MIGSINYRLLKKLNWEKRHKYPDWNIYTYYETYENGKLICASVGTIEKNNNYEVILVFPKYNKRRKNKGRSR